MSQKAKDFVFSIFNMHSMHSSGTACSCFQWKNVQIFLWLEMYLKWGVYAKAKELGSFHSLIVLYLIRSYLSGIKMLFDHFNTADGGLWHTEPGQHKCIWNFLNVITR